MKIFSVLFTTVFFFTASSSAATDVGGRMQEDTTWSAAGSPYVLIQSLIVEAGVTLTIEPGVSVELAYASQAPGSMFGIKVEGEILARGTQEYPIYFTSSRTESGPGDWGSIEFTETAVGAAYDDDGEYVSGSIFEYVTISYGGGTDTPIVDANGAAPYLIQATIQNNSQSGIKYTGIDEAHITGALFKNNIAERGGAIYAEDSELTIKDSTFTNNTNSDNLFVSEKGGTIYCSSAPLTMNNCTFAGGASDDGGALYLTSTLLTAAKATISRCEFTGSSARRDGGAIYYDSGSSLFASLTIDNSTFVGNVAEGEGGAFYHSAASLVLKNSVIAYNVGETAVSLFEGTIADSSIVYNSPAPDAEDGDPSDGIAVASSLTISGSNIFGHERYDIRNDSEDDITATGNYWNETDSSVIDSKIYDFFDDSSKGEVIYDPVLTELSPGAPGIPDEPTTSTTSVQPDTTTTIPNDDTTTTTSVIDNGTTTTPTSSSSTTTTTVEETQITVDFGASPTSGSVPLKVQFTNLTQSDSVISSYQWDFGDGSTSSEPEPVHTYAQKGTYGVKLTAYATDGTTAELFKENYIEVEKSVLPKVVFWTSVVVIFFLFIIIL
jgi:predicted outer membrane repeat protein